MSEFTVADPIVTAGTCVKLNTSRAKEMANTAVCDALQFVLVSVKIKTYTNSHTGYLSPGS